MRRILLVLSVAALMAAMMVVMAAPAFAAKGGQATPSLPGAACNGFGNAFPHSPFRCG